MRRATRSTRDGCSTRVWTTRPARTSPCASSRKGATCRPPSTLRCPARRASTTTATTSSPASTCPTATPPSTGCWAPSARARSATAGACSTTSSTARTSRGSCCACTSATTIATTTDGSAEAENAQPTPVARASRHADDHARRLEQRHRALTGREPERTHALLRDDGGDRAAAVERQHDFGVDRPGVQRRHGARQLVACRQLGAAELGGQHHRRRLHERERGRALRQPERPGALVRDDRHDERAPGKRELDLVVDGAWLH